MTVNNTTQRKGFSPDYLTCEEHPWYKIYTGTKQALISAGVVRKTERFPGEPGENKCSKLSTSLTGRKLNIERQGYQLFCVISRFSEEECAAAESRENFRKAQEEQTKELAWIPDSHARFRELSMRLVKLELFSARNFLKEKLGGYRFAPEAFDAFDEAVAELLSVLADAPTLFDAKAHKQKIAEIKAQTARADPDLQRFLEGVGVKAEG